MNIVQCQECGMREREEWVMQEKHICNKITDLNYPAFKGIYKTGKRRFVKII